MNTATFYAPSSSSSVLTGFDCSKILNLGIRNPDSGKILLMESGTSDFGFRNTAQGIGNPTKDWNPESKFH